MHDRGEMLLCKHIKAGKTRIRQSWRLWIIPVLLILLCPGFSDFSEHIVYHLNRLKARCKRKAQQRTCRSQFVLIRSAFRPKVLCLNIYNHIHICWYSQQKLVLLDLAGGTLDRGERSHAVASLLLFDVLGTIRHGLSANLISRLLLSDLKVISIGGQWANSGC